MPVQYSYLYWHVRFTGYYLATAAEDSVVKLWDLRKLKNFRSIALEDRYEIKALSFDYSGAYLAVAGTDVRFALAFSMLVLLLYSSGSQTMVLVPFVAL